MQQGKQKMTRDSWLCTVGIVRHILKFLNRFLNRFGNKIASYRLDWNVKYLQVFFQAVLTENTSSTSMWLVLGIANVP